jgi:hypothetical protein
MCVVHLGAFYLVSYHRNFEGPHATSCCRGFRPLASVLSPQNLRLPSLAGVAFLLLGIVLCCKTLKIVERCQKLCKVYFVTFRLIFRVCPTRLNRLS